MTFIKLSEDLWGDTTGEYVVGSKRRKREKENSRLTE